MGEGGREGLVLLVALNSVLTNILLIVKCSTVWGVLVGLFKDL